MDGEVEGEVEVRVVRRPVESDVELRQRGIETSSLAGGKGLRPSILLVGQAPSRTSDPRAPFSGRSGERLVAYSGLDREDFWRRVDAANLLDCWPGGAGSKGDKFSVAEARAAAYALVQRISKRVPRYALLILAGRKVAAAFDMEWLDWFEEFGLDPRIALVPHPSGVNHWWNEPANVQLARRKLREWVR